MRRFGLLLLTACLAGCGAIPDQGASPPAQGRYNGIGLYSAGDMWQRLVADGLPRDSTAATLRDDEVVIVVVDSRTGEVRQCGNITGYCIGSNPWARPLGRAQALPINVTEHRADVERARDRRNGITTSETDMTTNAVTAEPQPAHR